LHAVTGVEAVGGACCGSRLRWLGSALYMNSEWESGTTPHAAGRGTAWGSGAPGLRHRDRTRAIAPKATPGARELPPPNCRDRAAAPSRSASREALRHPRATAGAVRVVGGRGQGERSPDGRITARHAHAELRFPWTRFHRHARSWSRSSWSHEMRLLIVTLNQASRATGTSFR